MSQKLSVGTLLISEPFLPEEQFFRKLIVIIETSSESTSGIIINESLPNSICIAVEDKPELELTVPLLNGGPVGDYNDKYLGFIYLGPPTKNSIHLGGEYYYISDIIELIEQIETQFVNLLRTFAVTGYCGWGPGQLEAEIEEKTWIVSDFKDHYMNLKGDIAWKSALKDLGGEFALLANAPEDVQWN